jgi:Xaa-Pro aminopeptidase/Xaa-Pro dipeptidase
MDAFKAFRALVRPGMTERELASELDCALRRAGLAPAGFETIVAGGSNASRPHARSTWRAVEEGELLLIDFGGVYEGYHCDVTRTIPVGSVSARHIDLYRVVEEAQRRALAAIRSGMLCSDLDGLARAVITDAGYGDCFGHSLGHGLGLSVHEGPGIKRGNEDPLSSGMVFTIEPGIYLPGFAGVRIEDMVVLRDGGPDLLTDVAYEEFQGAG